MNLLSKRKKGGTKASIKSARDLSDRLLHRTMVEGNRDEPSLMDIRAKSTNKRKPSANKAHRARNDHRKKRRRSTLSSEIVIRTSSEPPILAASNRFEPIRSPSRKHEKRRSSQRDGNRRWVYSARDCSKFIGNQF